MGVLEEGAVGEAGAPRRSVLLHSLEQSLGLDGHPGPEGHFSASECIDLIFQQQDGLEGDGCGICA